MIHVDLINSRVSQARFRRVGHTLGFAVHFYYSTYLTSKNSMTLKLGVRVTQCYWICYTIEYDMKPYQ